MFTVTIRDILAKLITVARNKIVIKLNKYSFKEFNLQSCVIPVFDKIILVRIQLIPGTRFNETQIFILSSIGLLRNKNIHLIFKIYRN